MSDADTPRGAPADAATADHNIATPHDTWRPAAVRARWKTTRTTPRGRPARRRAPPPRSSSDDDSSRSKTGKEAAAPLTAPLAAPLTARVPDAAVRAATPAAQRAYEEKHADSDDDQPPTKPDKDSSSDDDGPVYDDMEDLHQGMKEMIGTDDFDMGRNLGMSTYFYTTFLKASIGGLFSCWFVLVENHAEVSEGPLRHSNFQRRGLAPVVGLVPRLRQCGSDAGLRRSGRRELAAARLGDATAWPHSPRSATSTTGMSLCGTSSQPHYYASF